MDLLHSSPAHCPAGRVLACLANLWAMQVTMDHDV